MLGDDWPIAMISDSNQQLQHELKYTLLKPDCHSWWISKMQFAHGDTLEDRYAKTLCFKLGKNAMRWNLDLLLWPRYQEVEFPVEACWLSQTQVARQSKSTQKLLMIPFFFYSTGIINMHWVSTGQTVNMEHYVEVLREFRKRFRRKRAAILQIGSVAFPPGICTSPKLYPCYRLFDQDGNQDSSSPSL